MIDVQHDFWSSETAEAFPDFERNVSELLALCRRECIDTVHLRAEFRADQSDWMARYKLGRDIPCLTGTTGVQTLSCAKESALETVIIKQTFDGFHNPELAAYLENNNKRFVLVAGLITSVCVLFTAASAAQRGYLVAAVEDCCADEKDAHEHTMARYPFVFGNTAVTDLVSDWDNWRSDLDRLTDT